MRKDSIGLVTPTCLAGIMGESRYDTPFSILEKIKGEAPDKETSDAMQDGLDLEVPGGFFDIRAESYYGVKPIVPPEGIVLHPTMPKVMGGHPDRFLDLNGTRVGLEYKGTGARSRFDDWGESLTDQIPQEAFWQVVGYLMLYPDLPEWHVMAWLGMGMRRHYVFLREEVDKKVGLGRVMDYTATWHHDHITKGIPIEPTNLDEVKRVWPEETQDAIGVDEISDEHLFILYLAHKDEKRIEKMKADHQAALGKILEGHKGITNSEGKNLVNFKTTRYSYLDQRKLKEKYPDAHAECMVSGESRQFRPSYKTLEKRYATRMKEMGEPAP